MEEETVQDYRHVKKGDTVEFDGFGAASVVEVFPLAYNRIVLRCEKLDISKKVWIVKTFEINDGHNRSSSERAQEIQRNISIYWEILAEAQVPVVKGLGFSSFTLSNKTTKLIQYEEDAGETSTVGIRDFKTELIKELILSQCQQIIQPLFSYSPNPNKPGMLLVGVDFIHRNLTFRRGDKGFINTVVDLFPSKMFLDGNYSLEYPEPSDETVRELGIFRSYHMVGILVNYWSHLVNIRPELAQNYYDWIEEFIHNSGLNERFDLKNSIIEYLEDRNLELGKQNTQEIGKVISDWGFKENLKLRLVACALAFHRSGSRHLLGKVFHNTHFQDKPLMDKQIDEVKELILQMSAFPVAG